MRRFLAGMAAAVTLAVWSPGVASAGTVWTIQAVPVPSNATYASLSGVSCWSKSGCIAVGRFCYRKHCLRTHALAESWNGSAWSIQALRKPGTTWDSMLSGISCVSARSCTTVGTAVGTGTVMAEHWDGSSWAVQPTPSPSGASLTAVSCTAAAQCTAVGYFYRAGTQRTLAEHWDGTSWAVQPTPSPSGASLTAVSCTKADRCTAVGNDSGTPLAEQWDGRTWAMQPIPSPSGSASTTLSGLSCVSPRRCIATGSYVSSGTVLALAEHWDGKSWAVQATPAVSGGGGELNAIWCVSAASCTAVGLYARGALAEYWNGSTWKQQQTTHPAGNNRLYGVSCVFPRTCTAVGAIKRPGVNPNPVMPLAEQE